MTDVLPSSTPIATQDEVVDWRYKGFPPSGGQVTVATVGEQGWNVLAGDLLFPLVLVKESALDHNIALMARYCREHGVSLAPHAKTPLSPQIVQRQLHAGAWGMTAATIHQARLLRAVGVSRILLANELVEPAGLRWVAEEVRRDPDFTFLYLVDSLPGVRIAEEALAHCDLPQSVPVLVELGVAGGRAGCRTPAAATVVAEAVRASDHLLLAGLEGYEGAINAGSVAERMAAVDLFLGELRRLTGRWARSGLFDGRDEIIVSAGGSNFFDRVVEVLRDPWDLNLRVRVVLRSGSYVTHDSDVYERLSPLAGRASGNDRLRPALEAWGVVLSQPEPGLAIVGFGKRDVPYDVRLPLPFMRYRSGAFQDIAGLAEVTALNDQHAFVHFDVAADLAVGDLLGCHLSHPCTTFDKWRLLPLVDDTYRVTGAIQTYF